MCVPLLSLIDAKRQFIYRKGLMTEWAHHNTNEDIDNAHPEIPYPVAPRKLWAPVGSQSPGRSKAMGQPYLDLIAVTSPPNWAFDLIS